MSRRLDRINGLLRQEISQLLSHQIKDPRLGGVISITQVKTSTDLRSARVYLSVLGDQDTKKDALEGINSAASYMRRELRERLRLRHVPVLSFTLDETIENADHLLRVIDSLNRRDASAGSPPEEDDLPHGGPLAIPPNRN